MKDIGEFELAESSLEKALHICRRIADTHQQGRVLIQMGQIIGHIDPDRGIRHIQRALPLIEEAREPRLAVCAQHALAWFLNDSGKPAEAMVVLDRSRPLYGQCRDELIQLRMHWLEAKIAHRLGDYVEAERIFGQVRDEFQSRSLHQEVVLVTIDQAQVLAAKGERARAAQLAAECYSIMKNWGLHKDALAAWLVLEDVLSRGQAA
jgi:ATP/maltotriose-dependent transcriptional regulator MalT